MKCKKLGLPAAGFSAGAINGLLGAGGGMVLVPLLTKLTDLTDEEIFPSSVAVILPVCIVSAFLSFLHGKLNFRAALPYLIGSFFGGILSGIFGKKIPVLWLHRFLGVIILWGGVRYLC